MNHFHPDYHDEDEIEKAYDSRLMKRLLTYLKPYRVAVGGAILLLLMGAGLRQVGPYLTKIAIDVHIAGGDRTGLNRIALIFITVHIVQFIVMYLQSYTTRMVGQRVMSDLRMEIFSHLQRLSLRFFDHLQQMTHLEFFALQVAAVVFIGLHFDRHLLHHAETVSLQADHLFGIVGQNAHFAHAQVRYGLPLFV